MKENHNGWAMVLVSDEHYHLWWDTINPIPEYLRFEATDMLSASRANATVPEGIVVTLPYDDVWPYLGVISSRGEAEATDLGLVNSRVDRTGNSYRSYENNTLSLLFSGRGNPGRGWWWNQRLRVYGSQCPPEGCPPPEEVSAVRTGPLRYNFPFSQKRKLFSFLTHSQRLSAATCHDWSSVPGSLCSATCSSFHLWVIRHL